ncbi:hypothetical protein BLNAU_3975 [Blattamonas nauphoetae]|uniref:Uncharacterized protein n=1 Tax=Blattamonas nauphoetae TaxID=2049346 RepID=A0ABQ9XA20_9EUKA|nr:hypothetical protein BLNAU_20158 [Blattamonas nauphoetae]KAK2946813.1 hypothetical protein BLNAU_18271 [Blattamonas nauphoetae]KAK2947050.1 hypothetical protein BLNAU_18052 [Blattamonas nauphoetae]KAK2949792.1 hypothetical protein BLNAU_15274 [Blattamonas nauphoetae]KAK2961207.1 hypothetical protein BLNAU_3975 [Blattamonas nauphoetae]
MQVIVKVRSGISENGTPEDDTFSLSSAALVDFLLPHQKDICSNRCMNRRNRGKPSCGTENPTSHGTVTVRLRLLSVRVQLQEEYLKARAEWDLLEHSLTEIVQIVIPSIQGLADGVCIGPSSVERCRCEGC